MVKTVATTLIYQEISAIDMQIKRICFPVKVLGPGNRIGIWTIGCRFNCKNCMSPELQGFVPKNEISVELIMSEIDKIQSQIDGFTISGGEPFEQLEELCLLVTAINKNYGNDIIIYSGYTIEELHKKQDNRIEKILANISVLIDGRYIEELNDEIGLRGSSNQRIHIFNNYERYEYLNSACREIQTFHYLDSEDITIGLL